jgi:hypothetical protein
MLGSTYIACLVFSYKHRKPYIKRIQRCVTAQAVYSSAYPPRSGLDPMLVRVGFVAYILALGHFFFLVLLFPRLSVILPKLHSFPRLYRWCVILAIGTTS